MNFNNAPSVHVLGKRLDGDYNLLPVPTQRRRVLSEPCLPERLPSSGVFIPLTSLSSPLTVVYFPGFIQREAEGLAPKAILRQLRRSPTPSTGEPETPEDVPDRARRQSISSMTSSSVTTSPKSPINNRTSGWTEPQVSPSTAFNTCCIKPPYS
jgi:hypothetical protein